MYIVSKVLWHTNAFRWDEESCEGGSSACRLFINRTKQKYVFVTKPRITKIYDFGLINGTDSDLLSEKLNGLPLLIYRDGMVNWSGRVHLGLRCHMDVVQVAIV